MQALGAKASLSAKLVLCYVHSFPGDVWAQQTTIADNLAMSRRAVQYALTWLEREGWLEKESRGIGKTNIYRPTDKAWAVSPRRAQKLRA